MKTVSNLRRKHLLTIHYPSGQDVYNIDFLVTQTLELLDALSALARNVGSIHLNALFSIVRDLYGYHVHIITNWLPTFNKDNFNQSIKLRIDRKQVIEIIERNNFVMDNPLEGIKPITFNPDYVETYVIQQPKINQEVVYTDRYFSKHFSPVHSGPVSQSYSSTGIIGHYQNRQKSINKSSTIISLISLFVISISILNFLLVIMAITNLQL